MNRKVMLATLIVVAIAIGAALLFSGMAAERDYLSEIETLIAQEDFNEAMNLIERFTENDPEYIQAQVKKAEIEVRQGSNPLETLEKILSIEANNLLALQMKAEYIKETDSKSVYYDFLLTAYDLTKDSSFTEKIKALKPLTPKLDKESGVFDEKVSPVVTNFNDVDQFYYSINGNEVKKLRKDTMSFIKDTTVVLYSENELGLKSDEVTYEYTVETFKKYLDKGIKAKEDGDLVSAIEYLEKALTFSESSEKVLVSLIDIYSELGEKNNLVRVLDLADYHLNDEKYGQMILTMIPSNPVFSLVDGFYQGDQTVSLLDTEDAVHYTLDGSDPSVLNPIWTDDITLSQGIHNIKAIAINDEGLASDIVDYYFEVDIPERELFSSQLFSDGSYEIVKRKLNESPDQNEVIFSSDASTKLTQMDKSPDGSVYALLINNYDGEGKFVNCNIKLMDPETLETNTIFETDEGYRSAKISFLDDNHLIYDMSRAGGDFGDFEIYKLNLDTKESMQLTNNQVWDNYPTVSGDKIIYSNRSILNWSYSSDIFMMDADGSNKINLINDTNPETAAFFDVYPVPNHDLSKIAFITLRFTGVDDGYKRQVAILDMRNGQIHELLDFRSNFYIQGWIDNDTVIVRTADKDGHTSILQVEMDGSYKVLEEENDDNLIIWQLMYK